MLALFGFKSNHIALWIRRCAYTLNWESLAQSLDENSVNLSSFQPSYLTNTKAKPNQTEGTGSLRFLEGTQVDQNISKWSRVRPLTIGFHGETSEFMSGVNMGQ